MKQAETSPIGDKELTLHYIDGSLNMFHELVKQKAAFNV